MDLRTLVRDLYGVDRPQGCTEAEIAAMKERFGAIPAVVEDFWRTFGHTKRLNCGQDTWIFPGHYSKWKWLEKYEDLILLNENQGVLQACVRREDLSLPDPPVYLLEGNSPRLLSAPAVSEFLEAALLYESVFQLEYSPEEFFEFTEADLAVIRSSLTKRPALQKNWFVTETAFYSNRLDNLVVIMDMGNGDYQSIYGGATEESYAALMEVLEGLGEPI